MAQARKDFDRMVRMDGDLYEQASTIGRIVENMGVKDYVAQAVREANERRQVKVLNAYQQLLNLTPKQVQPDTQ